MGVKEMKSRASATPKKDRTLPCGRLRPEEEAWTAAQKSALLAGWASRLESYLTEKKLKRSEQRLQILEVFLDAGGHLSAQDLVQEVARRFPGIGAATVYRSLKVLCDAQVLRETFADARGRAIFEVSSLGTDSEDSHHDHMICRDCGAVFEFHSEEIEALQGALLKKQGFREDGHRHVVYVRCEKLARSERAALSVTGRQTGRTRE